MKQCTFPFFIGLKGHSNRRLISLEEVKQHKMGDCIWTVLKGRVYNIAPYMKFHPGGNHFKHIHGYSITISEPPDSLYILFCWTFEVMCMMYVFLSFTIFWSCLQELVCLCKPLGRTALLCSVSFYNYLSYCHWKYVATCCFLLTHSGTGFLFM
jgi:hypothetical protein